MSLTETVGYLRTRPIPLAGAAIVFGLVVVAILAPLLAPFDPIAQDLYARLLPPSWEHPMGSDDFGRDILSRVIYGTRISLRIGIICISIALTVGTTLGLVAGYRGGLADTLIMRLVDIMLAFPAILLAIAIVAVIGPGIDNVMIAVSIVINR